MPPRSTKNRSVNRRASRALLAASFIAALTFAFAACAPAADESPDRPAASGRAAPAGKSTGSSSVADSGSSPASTRVSTSGLAPNELGRIPILEYHLFGDSAGRWQREHTRFRRDLELLYSRGYRPVSVADLVDRRIDLPAGLSPVVFTFDDASPSQFRFVERDGVLRVDSTSALGVWLNFRKVHPDWSNRATFCLLSGAEAGRSFFGKKDIEGQKTEWRFPKVRMLVDSGFELCNHTLWHAGLSKYPAEFVQEQIARLSLAVDSAVPGRRLRTLALPLGLWPRDHALAVRGQWRDPKGGRVTAYAHDAVLMVAGGPARSPYDSAFDPLKLPRVQVVGEELERVLTQLDRSGQRYVSDGKPGGP